MIWFLHPAILLLTSIPFVGFFGIREGARSIYVISVCLLSLLEVIFLWSSAPFSFIWETPMGTMMPLTSNAFSFPFALAFCGIASLGLLYGWKSVCATFQKGSLLCLAATMVAVFSGDVITLFLALETLFVATLVLIFAGGHRAYHPAVRYSFYQIISGFLFLAGGLCLYQKTGSWFLVAQDLSTWSGFFFFFSLGIKVAFPLLHPWLQDAYPSASLTGSVLLSAFSTKLGILLLCKMFAGLWILIPIGVVMTLFPIPYAAIENRMRRVLAYSLNNQLGFMVAAIGLGTPLAMSGATAHAFTHIFYKGLLFMTVGSAIAWAGSERATRMGGLFRKMPIAGSCCVIGAASISAVPLFSGFISKTLILGAFYQQHETVIWLFLLLASVGVLEHSGIKVPANCFLGKEKAPENAPGILPSLASNIAMIVAACVCVGIGVLPWLFYALLPYSIGSGEGADYEHIIVQMQILVFATLAFVCLLRFGLYPKDYERYNWDVDVIWRCIFPRFFHWMRRKNEKIKKAFDPYLSPISDWIKNLWHRGKAFSLLFKIHKSRRMATQSIVGASLLLLLSFSLYFLTP